jgi:hypothetical protein
MTLSDQYFVIGGVAAWGVAMSAIGVLWQRNIKLEGVVAKLQAQLAPGLAAQELLQSCPALACPYSSHRDDAPRPHPPNHLDPQPS